VDAARTALRLGAERWRWSTALREEMPATPGRSTRPRRKGQAGASHRTRGGVVQDGRFQEFDASRWNSVKPTLRVEEGPSHSEL